MIQTTGNKEEDIQTPYSEVDIELSKRLKNNEKTNNSVKRTAEMEELLDDHEHRGGLCSRKLYCIRCNDHTSWESFGYHFTQNCPKLEKGQIQCPACSKIFSSAVMLLLHYHIHFLSHPYNCVKCQCSYEHCTDICAQIVATYLHANMYRCYVCLGYFKESTFVNHMASHVEEPPFKCSVCALSFYRFYNLNRHLDAHLGLPPLKRRNIKDILADYEATLKKQSSNEATGH